MMRSEEMKAIRLAAGMSQKTFADSLGMTREAVARMESGKALIARRSELAVRYLAMVGPDGLPD